VGDPYGMEATHGLAAGMGGIRTAGDLVLRMQLTQKMKIGAAKKYVADRLGVTLTQLSDVVTMAEKREALGIGIQEPFNCANMDMAAKFRISRLLGIKINSVERFKDSAGI